MVPFYSTPVKILAVLLLCELIANRWNAAFGKFDAVATEWVGYGVMLFLVWLAIKSAQRIRSDLKSRSSKVPVPRG